ncbi:hypothetical protein FUA23_10975 [Neolewinella aurantiaca]|uniref:Exonuclease domain-containing protein n=1 Tax=Neolewinella aurantiaca TaxID=2602767 RepID=A0A5C7FFZ1_9BACT|nr:hypothetical protein [Neolewinella aurantiaca]TXF89266.1 hypothetical protein FUA23_10975 [Neolewinella aurantiaca]
MDALYLALVTSGPDPIHDRITQIAARLRRDNFTFVDLNQRVGEDNFNGILSQFNHLLKECEVLIGHNLHHQLDFLIAACVRSGNTARFIQLRRCKILCTKTLASHYHESEGKKASTTLHALLDELASIPLSVDPDAQSQVVATEIVHQLIFHRLQESPNFTRLGRDLVQIRACLKI